MSEAEPMPPEPTAPPPPDALPAAADEATRRAPWSALEIVLVVFLYFAWSALFFQALAAGGVYRYWYGQETVDLAHLQDEGTDSLLARQRLAIWAATAAFPFQLISVPAILLLVSGTRPERIGLTPRRAGRNALLGVIACAVLAPPVLGLHWAVLALYKYWPDVQAKEHLLQRLAKQGLSPVEWAAWLFVAVVAAPVMEEVLFRGVMQPWFGKGAAHPWLAVLLALLAAASMREGRIRETWPEGGVLLLEALAPPLFVLALVPPFLLVWLRWRDGPAPAVYATSMLFAVVHTTAWPSPVPLFVLSLGLGALAARTRSLVGPIVLHGLFNATSCVIFFGWR
jgi:membrane protease YdiL (CAAX protease family)